jgi:hypothetical protein
MIKGSGSTTLGVLYYWLQETKEYFPGVENTVKRKLIIT